MANAMIPRNTNEVPQRLQAQALRRQHEEALATIVRHRDAIAEVAKALAWIKAHQTYKLDMKYETWDAFCKDVVQFSSATANRVIQQYAPPPPRPPSSKQTTARRIKRNKDKEGGVTDHADPPPPNGTPQSPQGPSDCFGNEVPARCRDVYCDPWVGQTYDMLAKLADALLRADCQKGMTKRQNRYQWYEGERFRDMMQSLVHDLDAVVQFLKAVRPSGVCPRCGGKGCAECRHAGLVPYDVYRRLEATR